MTITVLLMTILTGQNHTVVAEYDTPKACEIAAQAHRKLFRRTTSAWSIAVLLKPVQAKELRAPPAGHYSFRLIFLVPRYL